MLTESRLCFSNHSVPSQDNKSDECSRLEISAQLFCEARQEAWTAQKVVPVCKEVFKEATSVALKVKLDWWDKSGDQSPEATDKSTPNPAPRTDAEGGVACYLAKVDSIISDFKSIPVSVEDLEADKSSNED